MRDINVKVICRLTVNGAFDFNGLTVTMCVVCQIEDGNENWPEVHSKYSDNDCVTSVF